MIKKILKIGIYLALILYLLMLFAGVIASGAIVAIVFALTLWACVSCRYTRLVPSYTYAHIRISRSW